MDYSRRDFVRTLFVASQAAVLGRFIPDGLWAQDISNAAFNFVVIGDWGRQGRPDQKQVAGQMAAIARDMAARFVITVGDNFYENGVTSSEDIQWQNTFENVYTAQSLQVPWYAILGNHDYHGNCEAQIEYGKTHSRWVMPDRHFNQIHQIDSATTLECFYIDTSPMVKAYQDKDHPENPHMRDNVLTQDVPAQLQWLDSTLAASKANWKVVFGHHPIYSGGVHGDQPELIEQVLPLLQKYKVQAYFCGHDHDLQHLKAGDIDLFVSGAGSEHRPNHATPHTQFGKSCSGFMAVSLTKTEMQVRVIDNLGKVLYVANVPQVGAGMGA